MTDQQKKDSLKSEIQKRKLQQIIQSKEASPTRKAPTGPLQPDAAPVKRAPTGPLQASTSAPASRPAPSASLPSTSEGQQMSAQTRMLLAANGVALLVIVILVILLVAS